MLNDSLLVRDITSINAVALDLWSLFTEPPPECYHIKEPGSLITINVSRKLASLPPGENSNRKAHTYAVELVFHKQQKTVCKNCKKEHHCIKQNTIV